MGIMYSIFYVYIHLSAVLQSVTLLFFFLFIISFIVTLTFKSYFDYEVKEVNDGNLE